MARILVTGGAGYIGSHTCLRLSRAGHMPIVFDNLSNGHRGFAKWGPFEQGDIRDASRLDEVFSRHQPEAIIHFASLIEVGHSVRDPLAFYDNNVGGTISLLKAAARGKCPRIVFSSTCATYGNPLSNPIDETHPQAPINPYGHTKLMIETILRDLSARGEIAAAMLRYFNAAGSEFEEEIGEWHDPETHVVPLAIATALGLRETFTLFGDTYDTPDGSCVRDYVHVMDLAEAHLRAVEHLLAGGSTIAVNLGTGRGTSVLELIAAVEKSSALPVAVERHPPRAGDATALVADPRRAAELLGWTARHDLASIVSSAFQWHRRNGFHSRSKV